MNKNEWKPIETSPKDGTKFIIFNGKEMLIINEPHGYAIGRWNKHGKQWTGEMIRFDNPTHWMSLPKAPKK